MNARLQVDSVPAIEQRELRRGLSVRLRTDWGGGARGTPCTILTWRSTPYGVEVRTESEPNQSGQTVKKWRPISVLTAAAF
jgi:hypothetical protein